MTLRDDILAETKAIFDQAWNHRDGNVVPRTADVVLAGGGVRLTPTMLYADMADSTKLASNFNKGIASDVIKAFLSAACRIIRFHGGAIRSFDGDRVMGVFIGERQNTRAALAAFHLNFAVWYILKPEIESRFASLATGGYRLNHGVGIDRSDVLVVRSGIRAHNDLIWVGRAPNIAAKLANFRTENFTIYITDTVFNSLAEDAKLGPTAGKELMWEPRDWTNPPVDGVKRIHRSAWWLRPIS